MLQVSRISFLEVLKESVDRFLLVVRRWETVAEAPAARFEEAGREVLIPDFLCTGFGGRVCFHLGSTNCCHPRAGSGPRRLEIGRI